MANEGDEQLVCSLYICPTPENSSESPSPTPRVIDLTLLEKVLADSQPLGLCTITHTSCGHIVAFALESDADKLVERDLASALNGPVQVARFSTKDTYYRQAVLLTDVPWAIPLKDVLVALSAQGITVRNISRVRQNIRVEIMDAVQYETILRQGLDFFGATRFSAVPERTYKSTSSVNDQNSKDLNQQETVLQCYRCQGFWHVAAHCRHLPRCVRCGENHSVQYCTRPRHNPICCHCAGPHHAAYRQCPVRLQLENATPMSISLTAEHNLHSKHLWTGGGNPL